jgi:2-amino-4-hydroxy-6-hydroxymethyldihydropteridine diphosphokinase
MQQPTEYIIVLGTNVGDRQANLDQAIAGIAALGEILQKSQVLETLPILIRAQGRFLNQGLRVVSRLNPPELLDALLALEARIGRQKRIKNGRAKSTSTSSGHRQSR